MGETQPQPGLVAFSAPVSVAQIFQEPGWGAAPAGLELLWQSISGVGQNPSGWLKSPQDGHEPPRMATIPLDFSGWEDLLFLPAAGAAG